MALVYLSCVWNPFWMIPPLQNLRRGSRGHPDLVRVQTLSVRDLCPVQKCPPMAFELAVCRFRV